ncbi:MAG: hypothetical protein LBG71_00390 [Clostridiales Family XIII bacterium]|jgi:hypothetical protein|nr:hypothetical protein [Clostridiales Family XIII bacterium]
MRGIQTNNIIVARLIIGMALAAALGFAACFLLLDSPPSFHYSLSVANAEAQSVRVSLKISAPLFCKKEATFVYLGDKNVAVLSCVGPSGRAEETYLSDGVLAIPLSRAGSTTLTYDARVAVPAKHGNRGAIKKEYAVFDGDQAFLLPASFYDYDDESVRRSVGNIRLGFDFPENWEEIVPFKRVDRPRWIDIYALSKNAFVFGEFNDISKAGEGLNVYALSGVTVADASGFESLFAYYAGLFEGKPSTYNVVLLPGDTQDKVIGGAGTGVVAASFDTGSLRDWQLLSHRMFHAFYDTFAPYANVHRPPNLWLNEGLATYYENMALEALPEPLASAVGANADRQFALLFDQYLYMRARDPFAYGFAPMDEDRMDSEAMKEFLHYTAAPLIVKALADEAESLGEKPDAVLRRCLDEETFEEPFAALSVAFDLLGDKAQGFCEDYLVGVEPPPLWRLKNAQPSPREILKALNDAEFLFGSWQRLENEAYPIYEVSEEGMANALNDVETEAVSFLPAGKATDIRGYCPELYALLNDWYRKARQQGIEFDDRELRFKLSGYGAEMSGSESRGAD